MALRKNWESLRDSFADILKQSVNGMIEETAADIDGPIRAAANRMAVAVRNNVTDLKDEIADDMALRFQEQGIRVKAHMQAPFDSLLTGGVNMLINGALAGLGAVSL
jgi:hypothetical protein